MSGSTRGSTRGGAVVLALSLMTACARREAASAPSSAAPSPAGHVTPTVREVVDRARPSVVVVRTSRVLGSGFVVSPGLVATNLHVVAGSDRIVVMQAASPDRPVSGVVGVDALHDLAVLSVDSIPGAPLELGDDTALRAGDPVIAIGTPQGLDLSVSTGVVSAVRTANPEFTVLQITAPISPGSSGGPILDQDGRVVGVATMFLVRGQNLNFAMPSRYLKELILHRTAPLSTSEFARLKWSTIRHPESQSGTSSPGTQRPAFPQAVAGFRVGDTMRAVKDACPGTFTEGKNVGDCSVPPISVPFARGPVRLYFDEGRLISIRLAATSFDDAMTVLREKYGPPDPPSPPPKGAVPRKLILPRSRAFWSLAGGNVSIAAWPAGVEVVYVASTWDERSNY